MQKEEVYGSLRSPLINKNILSEEHFNRLFSRKHLTFSQKTSDMLTKFAGSWPFILLFVLFLILWISINIYFLIQANKNPFDPYPFILLNLILSCIAAIQAPIILMSQVREAERDRLRAEYDYAVNRKAEKEIRDIQINLDLIKRKIGV
ncbi:DUF1003 domain-containing protein [Candidatus Pacearchaeota archaeon]|nr:DUF1003 domain-containing protein [Candidatus Pacearchaeota archaeon]